VKQPLKYATPMPVSSPDECSWYHTFELPDGHITRAGWDMRDCVDECLGHVDLKGKTAVEVGPANGFYTVSMEQRGASVTSVEVDPDQGWEHVPRADLNIDEWVRLRRLGSPKFFKAWWYTQKAYGCSAKMLYCGADALNDVADLLKFDVCLLAGVLQHVKHPMDLLHAASRLADTVIITERWLPFLEDGVHALATFVPAPDNRMVDSWWYLSTTIVKNAMQIFGFELQREARFNVKAWRRLHPDINQDEFALSEHCNMVFTRKPPSDAPLPLPR